MVQPYLEVVDIAGLVKGAADGAGLGNAFLSHIKATDGVIHCLRAFDDADVIHVEDRVDPVEDIEIITNELRVKDLEFMNNAKAKLDKDVFRESSGNLLDGYSEVARRMGLINVNEISKNSKPTLIKG